MTKTKEEIRAYQREYYRKNKQKVREYQKKYNVKNKAKRRAYQTVYGQKHRKKAKLQKEINLRQSVQLAYTASYLMHLSTNKAAVAFNQILSGERLFTMRTR